MVPLAPSCWWADLVESPSLQAPLRGALENREMQLVTVDEVMLVQVYHSQSVIDRMTEQKESSCRSGRPLALQLVKKCSSLYLGRDRIPKI